MTEKELDDIVTILANADQASSVSLSDAQAKLIQGALTQLAGDEQTIAILKRRLGRYEDEDAQIDRIIGKQLDHLNSVITSQGGSGPMTIAALQASAEDRANVLDAIDKAKNQAQVIGAVLRFVLAAVTAAAA